MLKTSRCAPLRISRLTDLYVKRDIDRDTYLERKRALMSERKSAEEQIARLGRDAAAWLQPLREWIKDAERLDKISKNTDPTIRFAPRRAVKFF